jgi:putative restriction endonuclease
LRRGYIGLTDPDWYTFLSAQPRVDEVNFWQPHGNRAFRALDRGDLFFFKLRAPLRDIAGFGFFERFESLPAWLAWETFGLMNGAPSFEAMVDRILRLRGDDGPATRTGQFQIGCIMISAPVFFAGELTVPPPKDWARTGIQQGKSYDLRSGEGARVLRDCLARAREAAREWNVDEIPAGDAARYGSPILVRPRLGQGLFSFAVRDAYQGACAVTHEHSQPVLEAAHIRPYVMGGRHEVDNGLLLRRDLHRLFDLGYVTVTPDHVFRVGDRLGDEFKNGRSYYGLDNVRIAIPTEISLQPSKPALDWHATTIFRG